MQKTCLAILIVFAAITSAYADAALLLEEPHGTASKFLPTGHTAVYLTNICADSPIHLRRCEPGEDGVVISRTPKNVADHDWLAIPLLPYLYAVENTDDIALQSKALAVASSSAKTARAEGSTTN